MHAALLHRLWLVIIVAVAVVLIPAVLEHVVAKEGQQGHAGDAANHGCRQQVQRRWLSVVAVTALRCMGSQACRELVEMPDVRSARSRVTGLSRRVLLRGLAHLPRWCLTC